VAFSGASRLLLHHCAFHRISSAHADAYLTHRKLFSGKLAQGFYRNVEKMFGWRVKLEIGSGHPAVLATVEGFDAPQPVFSMARCDGALIRPARTRQFQFVWSIQWETGYIVHYHNLVYELTYQL